MELDKTNQAILTCLKHNARQSWQTLGKQVFLTGQAVAARVQQMEEAGVISAYTIRQKTLPRHFVTMFMTDSRFEQFERFLAQTDDVIEAYKVSGEGCYHLVCDIESGEALEAFLNTLLPYGCYKVASSLRCVK